MELGLLQDIAIIFALSTFVNFLFTKIKAPTVIGYLLTGIVAGPHLLAFIHEQHQIELIAEIGVILLLFSVGMEFSLHHLLKIRKIVFLGGLMQLAFTAALVMLAARMYDMNWTAALFVGFIIALSSTAVVLKILQERSEVTSNYGRTVVGILIFQDIILVPLLLFVPVLGGESNEMGNQIVELTLKAVVIMAFVFVGNKWLMPKLLHVIALTKNKELFMMSVFLICISVALLTAEMGMSLAFGAFLAGLMISESEYSHEAFGNLIPFKDTFTSFFFVSIGMLLDLDFVFSNYLVVIGTVALVILIKTIVAGGSAFLLGHTFRGTLLVGIALAQVGEFSFILAKVGLNYNLISGYFYQLFIAVAVITISISPLLIQLGKPVSEFFLKFRLPRFLVEGLFPLPQVDPPEMQNHLVLIGKDSRAQNLSIMAKYLNLPYISIVFDPATARKRQKRGETVIYGDALNEPILLKAHVPTAEVIVVSVGDLITAMGILENVRKLNKHAFIIMRAKHVDDIEELYKLGADQVIPEEFETAIELFERVLKKFLLPRREIEKVIARIRDHHYGIFRETDDNAKNSILKELPDLEITALKVNDHSFLVDKTPGNILLRSNYGITLLAIKRKERIIDDPGADTMFRRGDIAYFLGKPDQIANAIELFSKESAIP